LEVDAAYIGFGHGIKCDHFCLRIDDADNGTIDGFRQGYFTKKFVTVITRLPIQVNIRNTAVLPEKGYFLDPIVLGSASGSWGTDECHGKYQATSNQG